MQPEQSRSEVKRGDKVRLDSAPEWQQPMTVTVVYHSGNLRLETKHGRPKVSIDPDAVEVL